MYNRNNKQTHNFTAVNINRNNNNNNNNKTKKNNNNVVALLQYNKKNTD